MDALSDFVLHLGKNVVHHMMTYQRIIWQTVVKLKSMEVVLQKGPLQQSKQEKRQELEQTRDIHILLTKKVDWSPQNYKLKTQARNPKVVCVF